MPNYKVIGFAGVFEDNVFFAHEFNIAFGGTFFYVQVLLQLICQFLIGVVAFLCENCFGGGGKFVFFALLFFYLGFLA